MPRIARAAAIMAGLSAVIGTAAAQTQSPPAPPASVLQGAEAPAAPPSALQGASTPRTHSLGNDFMGQQQVLQSTAGSAEALLKTPVSTLHPGGAGKVPPIENPMAHDPSSATRGMTYFNNMNCVGCHAANGGGGMGRALSNRYFQYGATPADIYLSIVQGRPNGMPAWGNILPANVIWDLVSYIQQISKDPNEEWGTTISASSPTIEQVPAEFQSTADPWSFTEPFSHGQKPQGREASK
jgi:cytochrome c oxidase cbb3-type subunit III